MLVQQQVKNGPALTHITLSVIHFTLLTSCQSHLISSVWSVFQPRWGVTDVADPGKKLQNWGQHGSSLVARGFLWLLGDDIH